MSEAGERIASIYPRWVRVALVREGRVGEYRAGTIRDPQDVALVVEPLLRCEPQETMLALLLDTKHRPNAIHMVSRGGLDHCPCDARAVFQPAILANAAGVILAHNHPSGDPTPSKQDVRLTARLIDAGEIVGVDVLDHLVIGDRAWVSIRKTDPQLGWERGGRDA